MPWMGVALQESLVQAKLTADDCTFRFVGVLSLQLPKLSMTLIRIDLHQTDRH